MLLPLPRCYLSAESPLDFHLSATWSTAETSNFLKGVTWELCVRACMHTGVCYYSKCVCVCLR